MATALRIWHAALLGAALLATACDPGPKGRAPRLEDAKALQKVVSDVEQVNKLLADYEGALGKVKADYVPTADQRKMLLSLWAPYLDHMRALHSYQFKFLQGWKQAGSTDKQIFALTAGVTALAAQTSTNLRFLRAFGRLDQFKAILNDPDPEYGVGANEYDAMLVRMAKPQTRMLLQVGVEAMQRRAAAMRAGKEKEHIAFTVLADKALAHAQKAEEEFNRQAIQVMMQGFATVLGNQFDQWSGALITDIAEWLGDTRLRATGKALISQAQIDWLTTQAQPGDVIVERRNWYLSNLGLPGFWPHAAFYAGSPQEIAAALDGDAGVKAAFGDKGLTGYLEKTFPDHWKEYASAAHDGKPHRVIEAISEGVSMASLHESCAADYVGVMRPRLSKVEKARAIVSAFSNLGKPYDFDFDFLTESTLVCSEVVYVAYRPEKGVMTGLTLPLEEVMGRKTLPPTNLVELFDTQFGKPEQQMDFVAFLDGREASGTAVVATEADLRASWRRPKWDLSQQ
ncbi:MAG: hypothetical protein FJ100_21735 [Deltaproteobacteria bacterium]|nr:hypothetical protein [Deltaproteobacteria bacterium]